jgi:hypothetical protein
VNRTRLASLAVLAIILLIASGNPTAAQTQSPGPQQLSVPAAQIAVMGPTIVHLVAQTSAGQRVYQIGVRKRLEGEAPQRAMPLEGQSYTGTDWSGLDTVKPESTYYYQVRAESGSVTEISSDWSAEVIVKTPSAPTRPPAAPRPLSATARGSFQVELTWKDVSDNEYGFEISRVEPGGPTRIALLNPNTTQLIVHGIAPGSSSTFSIRAFNPAGVSAAMAFMVVPTPELWSVPRGQSNKEELGPCRTHEEAIHDVEEAAEDQPAVLDRQRIRHLGGNLNLDIFPIPGSCGNANCGWLVYGVYNGCYRKLDESFGVGLELVGQTPAGVPLLLEFGHRGGMETGYDLMTLERGQLVSLDDFVMCEAPSDALTKLSPVFSTCQYDERIRPQSPR